MPEIILNFIQCHHCGENFDLDDPLANVHWKDCQHSPAREEWEAMKALLLKIRYELALAPAHFNTYRFDELIKEIDALLGDGANGHTHT